MSDSLTENATALVVDDEPRIVELHSLTLKRMGINVLSAQTVADAAARVQEQNIDFCLTDLKLPDGTGLEVLTAVQEAQPETPVAVITAFGDIDTATEALKLGAFDFVSKPVDLNQLRTLATTALRLRPAEPKVARRQSPLDQLYGVSEPMLALKKMIEKVARSQAPLHITGESGTGKERVARTIHEISPRQAEPFIAVNCGAIPAELMESEFFGHQKGSFTGATSHKEGLFRAANGGTLFLDEVADLPAHMQVKLLRALQEKAVRPIGAHDEVQVDVRIISATHKNLAELIERNSFREDLYYRINVIQVDVPALSDRREDIPGLVNFLCQRYQERTGTALAVADDAIAWLAEQTFPGNIRELENSLERAAALCDNQTIALSDLQHTPQRRGGNRNAQELTLPPGVDLDSWLESIELKIIAQHLAQNDGNKTATAESLGISFRQLRYKLKKLEL
jgi:two-component system response regulator PilR (NtrC family)